MKKTCKSIMVLVLMLGMTTINGACLHVHDEECKFDSTTNVCNHEHTSECYGVNLFSESGPRD